MLETPSCTKTQHVAPLGKLFSPLTIKSLTLENRIVMAPMGRHFAPGGLPDRAYANHYRRRAEGGTGLVITEASAIPHPVAARADTYSRFHGADALAVWAEVLEEVHGAGGKIFPQLWHAGLLRKPGDLPNAELLPVGPSGLYSPASGVFEPAVKVAEPATQKQIDELVAAYGRAALSAKTMGFDGIDIHGAHGYLIDQFFWEVTNRRTDAYGGDLVRRTRFAVEVIEECRRQVGPDFPIFLRFSQWKQQDYTARLAQTPQELEQFLTPLARAGVDLFDCSQRRFWQPEFAGSDLNLAGWTKKITGVPTMTVGSVGLDTDVLTGLADAASDPSGISRDARPEKLDRLLEMLDRGDFDLVAVGRALITNPDWANQVRLGTFDAINPYSVDHLKTLD